MPENTVVSQESWGRTEAPAGKTEGATAPSESILIPSPVKGEGRGEGGAISPASPLSSPARGEEGQSGSLQRMVDLENQLKASAADFAAYKVTADKTLESARSDTLAAVRRVAEAVRAANPDIPPELIAGSTLAEVDASLSGARMLVEKVKTQLKTVSLNPPSPQSSPARGEEERVPVVPAGAPGRTFDLGDLSPLDKIKAGIRKAASHMG